MPKKNPVVPLALCGVLAAGGATVAAHQAFAEGDGPEGPAAPGVETPEQSAFQKLYQEVNALYQANQSWIENPNQDILPVLKQAQALAEQSPAPSEEQTKEMTNELNRLQTEIPAQALAMKTHWAEQMKDMAAQLKTGLPEPTEDQKPVVDQINQLAENGVDGTTLEACENLIKTAEGYLQAAKESADLTAFNEALNQATELGAQNTDLNATQDPAIKALIQQLSNAIATGKRAQTDQDKIAALPVLTAAVDAVTKELGELQTQANAAQNELLELQKKLGETPTDGVKQANEAAQQASDELSKVKAEGNMAATANATAALVSANQALAKALEVVPDPDPGIVLPDPDVHPEPGPVDPEPQPKPEPGPVDPEPAPKPEPGPVAPGPEVKPNPDADQGKNDNGDKESEHDADQDKNGTTGNGSTESPDQDNSNTDNSGSSVSEGTSTDNEGTNSEGTSDDNAAVEKKDAATQTETFEKEKVAPAQESTTLPKTGDAGLIASLMAGATGLVSSLTLYRRKKH